jgi:urease accessory protein
MTADWLLLQLADSGFPAGGFAHSGGLEAAAQAGAPTGAAALADRLDDVLWACGNGALPFVAAAHDDPGATPELDRHQDAALANPVANRASRVQGRAHLDACVRAFQRPALTTLRDTLRVAGSPRHHAPVFGASLRALDLGRDATLRLFLHGTLRGAASSAVRLALLGPAEAQGVVADRAPTLDRVLAACADRPVAAQAQTAPLHDLLLAGHDRLYSRLFQS